MLMGAVQGDAILPAPPALMTDDGPMLTIPGMLSEATARDITPVEAVPFFAPDDELALPEAFVDVSAGLPIEAMAVGALSLPQLALSSRMIADGWRQGLQPHVQLHVHIDSEGQISIGETATPEERGEILAAYAASFNPREARSPVVSGSMLAMAVESNPLEPSERSQDVSWSLIIHGIVAGSPAASSDEPWPRATLPTLGAPAYASPAEPCQSCGQSPGTCLATCRQQQRRRDHATEPARQVRSVRTVLKGPMKGPLPRDRLN